LIALPKQVLGIKGQCENKRMAEMSDSTTIPNRKRSLFVGLLLAVCLLAIAFSFWIFKVDLWEQVSNFQTIFGNEKQVLTKTKAKSRPVLIEDIEESAGRGARPNRIGEDFDVSGTIYDANGKVLLAKKLPVFRDDTDPEDLAIFRVGMLQRIDGQLQELGFEVKEENQHAYQAQLKLEHPYAFTVELKPTTGKASGLCEDIYQFARLASVMLDELNISDAVSQRLGKFTAENPNGGTATWEIDDLQVKYYRQGELHTLSISKQKR